jgi:predicted ester cyclase
VRGASRSLGTLIGESSDLAVVVTETVAVAAALPFTVTLDGDTEQAGPAGATLHFSATVPVKPPLPANEIG